MTWTVTKESGAVSFSDWLAEEANAVSAEQRALAEAFRQHPPVSLKLTILGQPDPFEMAGAASGRALSMGAPGSILETLLDRLEMMILAIDARGAVESANQATASVLGFAPEEIVGRQVLSLFAEPSRRNLLKHVLPQYFATGRLANVAVELATRSGETADLRMTAVGEMNGQGGIDRAIAVFAPAC